MKSVKLDVGERNGLGTAACRRLRAEGRVPLNLYGLDRPTRQLDAPAATLRLLLDRGVHIVDLTLGDKTQAALIKEVQYDAIGVEIMHADLQRVDRDKPVHVYIGMKLIGTAPEVSGSIVEKIITSLQIECLPLEIPDDLVINLSTLAVGSAVKVGDLALPAGAKVIGHHAEDIVIINHVKVVKEEAPVVAEGAAEPELIGKKAKAGDEAAPATPDKGKK